ncbi:rifin PIR protein, putative [Plasmodium sp. gorilla clade G2]|uniref:rifin PIR protein, putative n=1 Tax=Plasmodium sp. gorilla clade G2 TaxID=880535 RepID=UPI000D29AF60|nr:rifin PIR protein, putative [Plasmodium sp. gorilla clade G2]SOV20398.1 rifin PIR protein, putative [Plasmodium sp. gorilla clade G2]
MLLHLILMNKLLFLLAYWNLQRNFYTLYHITRNGKIITWRRLCEIDLYEPNYDNDPEMKKVMDNFNLRTQKRFYELNERIKEKRKKFNEKCDKDIKEIIVKDKIEKQLIKKLSVLEKLEDRSYSRKGKSEKRVEKYVQKCYYKKRKTLGTILSEWDILANIDMYEWIPFCSTGEHIDGNIKNIKDAVTKVGYIKSNNSTVPENKGSKDTTELGSILSSILGSSNSLFQKYIDDKIKSNGVSFKKQTGYASFFIYVLSEFVEHVVIPVGTTLIFGHSGNKNNHETTSAETQMCKCSCELQNSSKCTCICTCANKSTYSVTCSCICSCKCACKGTEGCATTCACAEKCVTACTCAEKCVKACICAEKCVTACECACAHHSHNHMFIIPISSEGFITAYTIASVLLFLYFILKFYRKIRREKKQKYIKLLNK